MLSPGAALLLVKAFFSLVKLKKPGLNLAKEWQNTVTYCRITICQSECLSLFTTSADETFSVCFCFFSVPVSAATCFFLKFFSWFVLQLLWIVLFFGSHPLHSSLPLFSSYLFFGSCPLFGYLPFFVFHYLFSFLPIYVSLPLWFLSSLWFCSTLAPFPFGPHPLFGSLERVLACTCKLWDLFPAGPEFACLVS